MVTSFLRGERGLELSEYAFIAALIIGAVVVAFITPLGSTIVNRVEALVDFINSSG